MRCIYIPTNAQNSHWTVLIIFIVEKNIRYYDSMNGGGDHFLDAARRWVVDEGRVKKHITIDPEDWALVPRQAHVPQQGNGFDCGVFSCMCADYIVSLMTRHCSAIAKEENIYKYCKFCLQRKVILSASSSFSSRRCLSIETTDREGKVESFVGGVG